MNAVEGVQNRTPAQRAFFPGPSERIAAVLLEHSLTWQSTSGEPWFDCVCGQDFRSLAAFTAHQAERVTQLPIAWVG